MAVLLCLLAGACATPTPIPSPTPIPTPTSAPTPEPLARTELPLGVQVFESDVETPALEHLRGAGVAWARTRALWKLIEREPRDPPVYDWTVTDWLFGDTVASGFRNVAVVYANPDWVSERECQPVPDAHLARYAMFWTALVERYDGDGEDDAPDGISVDYWQVGNEPDFDPTAISDEGDYGSCFGNDPAAYAEQLKVAYEAVKRADAQAQVGFAPLAWDRFTAESAPEGWPAAPGPFVYDFAQRAIEHLYGRYPGEPELPYFDFIGLHNYNDNAHYWDDAPTETGRPLRRELVGKVARFRSEQLNLPGVFDLRRMPVMISETGLATSPSDDHTERNETLQAVYVGQTMVRAMAAEALAAIWYTARDNIFGDCLPPHYDWLTFGLMRADAYAEELRSRCPRHDWADLEAYALDSSATPRPAMRALATLTRSLRGYSYERQLGPDETGDPRIEAYLFRGAEGRSLVAAWTGDGQRLGKRGAEQVTANLRVDARSIAPWSGRLRVVEHLGRAVEVGEAGAEAVDLLLNAAPAYLTSLP